VGKLNARTACARFNERAGRGERGERQGRGQHELRSAPARVSDATPIAASLRRSGQLERLLAVLLLNNRT
jgi:hypothetical protein